MSSRRQYQKAANFLEPRRKGFAPLTPDFASLPASKRTDKRVARAIVREIEKPLPKERKPQAVAAEPVLTTRQKLIQWGWIREDGTSVPWRYWNSSYKTFYYASVRATDTEQE